MYDAGCYEEETVIVHWVGAAGLERSLPWGSEIPVVTTQEHRAVLKCRGGQHFQAL